METDKVNITRQELDSFMKQIEGIKSTIEILQNKEMMEQIVESEKLKQEGAETLELNF